MPQLLKSKTVTARKPHRCACCGEGAVKVGERYQRETYIYDGRVYDWVSCNECASLQMHVWDWAGRPEEGIGADAYIEWAREHHEDREHGQCARAYLARVDGDPR